jgi:hypothetical protein
VLPFGVTIPGSVPQRSEILEGLMNYPVYAMAGNNCKFIIIQLSDLFLSKIFISTDSDAIIMPDITSKLYAGVIFLIVNVYFWWGGECTFDYFSSPYRISVV